jgi:hypothetical protein
MGFPWLDWLAATRGDMLPLALWAACTGAYYLAGVARMLMGWGPWREEDGPDGPDLPDIPGGPLD